MKKFKEFVFGVRVEGEKLRAPKPIKERPLDYIDYMKWCKEFRVGMLSDRKVSHF
jgi:hypothetical protein